MNHRQSRVAVKGGYVDYKGLSGLKVSMMQMKQTSWALEKNRYRLGTMSLRGLFNVLR